MDLVGTALELLGEFGSHQAHVLSVGQQLGHHVSNHLETQGLLLLPQPRRMSFESLSELRGVRLGGVRRVRRFLQQELQAFPNSLECIDVASQHVLRVEPSHVGFGEWGPSCDPLLQYTRQLGVDSGDVLVPQSVTGRMKCGLLSGHERQRRPEDFGALLLVLLITHTKNVGRVVDGWKNAMGWRESRFDGPRRDPVSRAL